MKLKTHISRHDSAGSALIISMVTMAVLAFAAAAISVSVSTTANVSLQAATWQEAIMAAEAGADTAMASFRVALDEGPTLWNDTSNALTDTKTGATAWADWTTVTANRKLSLSPVFRAASGATTGMQATVTIEAPNGWTTAPGQWYRIRSTGISGISGPPRVGMDRRDNDLRKISLINTRDGRSGFPVPASVGPAHVTRSVELIVAPIPNGIWDRAITSAAEVHMGAKFVVDSYHSGDSTKSTNGFYDVLKRQSNADVASNTAGKDIEIGDAHVYGDLAYNTGTAKHTTNLHGTNTNTFYQQLVDIKAPVWNSYNNTPTAIVNTNTTLDTGPITNPARYVLSEISQNTFSLDFNTPSGSAQRYVEIYVTKDVSFSNGAVMNIPSNVHVSIYVAGKFSVTGTAYVNNGSRNAANLSLYGIAGKGNPQWEYNSNSDFIGTIYGPQVKFKVTGSANFYGAVIANTVHFGGADGAGFHFDEALLVSGTSTPRYQVASWIEDVR